ncbi:MULTISPECIES: energy transducer TonB [Alphaproteobacteria]|uniref:Biopolymer transporter TonB n=2 Tax=Alphaproteobacteria TaxID=28211 RepID=A0A512HN87_9HYPH|nr:MULTISPECIES: energy transducer TonB [Alphaproteobacteria]GEO86914.1 biopolymer transporter TonB [Ciceribacter naphthalenivorans]GLR22228.1 biopolymer transporter TonB [Ciceribacter naphthalenivorans]GLT05084.1 biopolymer transporter TonB [Sphingomonas psychrolutea]
MTRDPIERSKGRAVGELLLWSTAAVCVAAAHAGAVALLMQQPEIVAADAAPPAAIMIELAPEPVVDVTEEKQIVPDQLDADEVKTASHQPELTPIVEPEPLPELSVEEVVEPVTEPPPLEPEPPPVDETAPLEQMALAQLENMVVPIPVMRPPRLNVERPKKKVEAKPVAKRQPPPPASQAARKAKAEIEQADRTAAKATSDGGGRNVSPAKWQSRLMSHLERRKRYPSEARREREEGTVYVRFRIDDGGNVLSVSLSRSSGHASLDQAVLDMVRHASPVPAPPPGVSKTITAPVRFNMR